MPRAIQISASEELIDKVLQEVESIEGIIGITRQPGVSLVPRGDMLMLTMVNEATRPVLSLLDELGIADQGTIEMSEPSSVMSKAHQNSLDNEANETVWDEMAFLLRGDTNPSINYLVAMAMAGAVAAGGLWTDTLHLVVGAMIIAPAFEPLARLPFALVTGARHLISSGIVSILAGNFMLILGAVVSSFALLLWDSGGSAGVKDQHWVLYWSSATFPGVLVSTFGAVAGAVVIGGQRAVLTTGVMITLALIPSMALVGVGIVTMDFLLAAQGLMRWAIDALLVIGLSALVFWLKQKTLHRGEALS